MKTFSRHFKSLVALLLTVIMLVGVALPVVANAASAVSTGSAPSTGGSSSGNGGSAPGSTGNTTEIDTGWFVLEQIRDPDTGIITGITVTLHPEKDALLNIGRDQLTAILAELIDSFKSVVIDQIKNEMMGGEDAGNWVGSDKDSIWENALNLYIKNQTGSSSVTEEDYISFFKDMITDDAKVNDLADYICSAIKLACLGNVIKLEDLPNADEQLKTSLQNKFEELFTSKFEAYKPEVKQLVIDAVKSYIDNYGTSNSEDGPVYEFVASELPGIFDEIITDYIDNVLADKESGSDFDDYINEQVNLEVEKVINSLDVEGCVSSCLDDYLANIKSNLSKPSSTPLPVYPDDGDTDNVVKNYIIREIHNYFTATDLNGVRFIDNVIYGYVETYITARGDSVSAEAKLEELLGDPSAAPTSTQKVYRLIDDIVNDMMSSDAVKEYARDEAEKTADDYIYELAYDKAIELLRDEYGIEWETLSPSEKLEKQAEFDEKIKEYKNDPVNKVDEKRENKINEELAKLPTLCGDRFAEYYEKYLNEKLLLDTEAERAQYFGEKAFAEAPVDFNFADAVSEADKNTAVQKAKDFVDGIAVGSDEFSKILKTYFNTTRNDSVKFRKFLDDTFGKVMNKLKDDPEADDLIAKVVNTHVTDQKIEETAYKVIGVKDFEELKTEVSSIIDVIASKYGLTLDELEDSQLDFATLVREFKGLTVDNLRDNETGALLIYDGALNMANIKTLLKELPTLAEIADKDVSDMYLSYAVKVMTTFGNSEFDVTIKMAENCPDCTEAVYDKLRTALKLFNEHVKFSISGTTLELDIEMPERFDELVLKAINSGRIPESLKDKIFYMISEGTLDKAYTFYGDLTFDEIITLLEAVDFEGIIAVFNEKLGEYDLTAIKEIIARYVDDVDGLTNEQIIEKAKELETRFNDLKNKLAGYITKAYNKIPDVYKDKTIFELGLYDGSVGGIAGFSFDKAFTITQDMIDRVQFELMERFPQHRDKINFLFGLIDVAGTTVGIDFSLKVQDIARVTYKIGDTVVRDGFLPKGADPALYVRNIKTFEGRNIIGWTYEDGTECTSMPAEDIVLVAKLQEIPFDILVSDADKVISTESGFAIVYDGNTYEIKASLNPEHISDNATVTYQWTKKARSSSVPNASGDTLYITGRDDIGTYTVVATVDYPNEGYQETYTETFTIDVTLPSFELDLTDSVNGQRHDLTAILTADNAYAPSSVTYNWYWHVSDPDSLAPINGVSGNTFTAEGYAMRGYYRVDAVFTIDGEQKIISSDTLTVDIADVEPDFDLVLDAAQSPDDPYTYIITPILSGNYTPLNVTYKWYYGETLSTIDTENPYAVTDGPLTIEGYKRSGYYLAVAEFDVIDRTGLTETSEPVSVTIDTYVPDFTITADLTYGPGEFDAKIESTLDVKNFDPGEYTVVYQWYYGDYNTKYSNEKDLILSGAKKSGFYTLKVTVTAYGKDNTIEIDAPIEVVINQHEIKLDKVWNYAAFDITDPAYIFYNGGDKKVNLEDYISIVDFEGVSANAFGEYTAKATIKAESIENYIFEGGLTEVTLKWYIVDELSLDGTPAPGDVSWIYDGNDHNFKGTIPAAFDTDYEVSYKWYQVVVGEEDRLVGESNTLTLKNVPDSGSYKLVVTATAFGYTQTKEIAYNVTISPAVIDLGSFTWADAPANFAYDGKDHVISIVTVPSEYKDLVIVDQDLVTDGVQANIVARKPGNYKLGATVTLVDDVNYVLDGTVPTYQDLVVSKAVKDFDFSKISWNYTKPIDFIEGATFKVFIKGYDSFTFGDIVVLYETGSVTEATAPGIYSATFAGFAVDQGDGTYGNLNDYYNVINYDSFGAALTLEWQVVGKAPVVEPEDEYIWDQDGIYVKVEDPNGKLHGYDMHINRSDLHDYVYIAGVRYKILEAYDIVFKNSNGIQATFGQSDRFPVTFKIPSNAGDKELHILYLDDNGDLHELMQSVTSAESGEISFEAKHFSIYGIAVESPEETEDPGDEQPTFPEIPPIVFVILAALLVLLVLILIIKLLKKLTSGRKLRKRLLVNEYDETAELYEDLAEYENKVNKTVYFEGETPDDAFIDPEINPDRENNDVESDPNTDAGATTEIPTEKPKPAPIIITPDYVLAAGEGGQNVVPVTFIDSDGSEKTVELETAPLVVPTAGEKEGEIVMAPVVATIPLPENKEENPEEEEITTVMPVVAPVEVTEEVPAIAEETPVIEASDATFVSIAAPAENNPEASEPVLIPEAPIVSKTGEVINPTADTPIIIKKPAVKHEDMTALEAPTVKLSADEEEEIAEEPVEIVEDEASEPIEEYVPGINTRTSADVYLTVEKSEENLAKAAALAEAAAEEPIEEVVEEPVEEVVEEAVEESVEEAIDEPVDEVAIEFVENLDEASENDEENDDDNDSDEEADEVSEFSGQFVGIRYRRSFTSRLCQASDTVKEYYSMIKNAFLSFKGVKARTSWGCETFNKGRITLGKMSIKGKTLILCLNLNPKDYENTKYHFRDVSEVAKYSKVPMLVKVKSMRGLKYAVDLVGEMMDKLEIQLGKFSEEDFRPEFMTTEQLIENNLIKVILPKGVSVDENDTVVAINTEEPAPEAEEATALEAEEATGEAEN